MTRNGEGGWMHVPEAEELDDGEMISIDIADGEVLLAKVEGELFAIDNVCTHAWGRLDEGILDGHEVQCPLHVGRFDVRTGEATKPPAKTPVRTYAVRVDRGQVYVATAAETVTARQTRKSNYKEESNGIPQK